VCERGSVCCSVCCSVCERGMCVCKSHVCVKEEFGKEVCVCVKEVCVCERGM